MKYTFNLFSNFVCPCNGTSKNILLKRHFIYIRIFENNGSLRYDHDGFVVIHAQRLHDWLGNVFIKDNAHVLAGPKYLKNLLELFEDISINGTLLILHMLFWISLDFALKITFLIVLNSREYIFHPWRKEIKKP